MVVGPNAVNVFSPTTLTLNVGDIISFQFNSSGHNVRETVGDTCFFAADGFRSPAVPNVDAPGTVYNLEVTTSQKGKTIYCACGTHW